MTRLVESLEARQFLSADPMSAAPTTPVAAPAAAADANPIERRVYRTLTGFVHDGDGRPLEGVTVDSPLDGFTNAAYASDDDWLGNKPGARIDGDFEMANVLVGYNQYDRSNRRFIGFRPLSVTFSLVARDIEGNSARESVSVGPVIGGSSELATDWRDGEPIDVGVLRLGSYKTVSSDGVIRLHGGHTLRQLGLLATPTAKAIELSDSPRYRAEVTAVTQRLQELGFRQRAGSEAPLAVTDSFDGPPAAPSEPPGSTYSKESAPSRAVRLFRAIWKSRDTKSAALYSLSTPNEVGPTTLKLLNSLKRNTQIWKRWAANDSAAATQVGNFNPYLTSTATEFLRGLAGQMSVIAPGRQLQFNSGSNAVGGRFKGGTGARIPGDTSLHTVGGAIDLSWIPKTKQATQGDYNAPANQNKYDRPATARLIVQAMRLGAVEILYGDPAVANEFVDGFTVKVWADVFTRQKTLKSVTFNDAGHKDHVHVGVLFREGPAAKAGQPTAIG